MIRIVEGGIRSAQCFPGGMLGAGSVSGKGKFLVAKRSVLAGAIVGLVERDAERVGDGEMRVRSGIKPPLGMESLRSASDMSHAVKLVRREIWAGRVSSIFFIFFIFIFEFLIEG